ncbi:DUF2777 domain-containing protein [Bacillus halotolerans]|uniref:DUF2777 domain-containing protein n=1 Tax=Bacillus halotolerans TaxID=260554 RepID=UPI000D020D98|nr:DUF2777 domain-containing protein [Bacillus halotolerans]MEC1605892.1 DUF2777 domain-containing protein [Bacillus halotolerans]PRP53122.1 DUF2777 domain-containing protein [Bacillus halotolerans]PRP58343.1 DUF2777 domain-containing protein [Bacillus halotolerans]PRP62547.1 DUF2777 domain-containing protein [Bacillus halotolerans]
MKRKQFLYKDEQKWEYGTILVEDGICLIENQEGEVLLAESLQNRPIWIQREGKWEQADFQDKMVLICCGEDISLSGGECIRYEKSVKRPLMTLLDSLDDETFLAFLQHLHSFGLSVFDCVFSYNKEVFSNISEEQGVSFYHFSNDTAQCALQHHYSRGTAGDRFEWTASDGKRSIMYSAVQRGRK